ncbi:MAG: hypothetical protein QNJ46_31420 [Leptolyngbyaceae cyanobacterium MO_188.B28]|nr:hypothetical protein [Leptolyngbyaceae cyanobacterium MO_188.B28]
MNRSPATEQFQRRRNRRWLKLGLLALLSVLFVINWQFQESFISQVPNDSLAQSLAIFQWIDAFGPLKPLAFILIFSLFTILFIPTATVVLSAGKISAC